MFSTRKPSALDLDTPLLGFSDHDDDTWRIRDAVEGCQIFGGTGSGKTSGSGAEIALSYMRHGFGGLILTAKNDERRLWERYAQATGRADDLIIFSPESPARFNFLKYEQERQGAGAGLTENMVALFINAMEANRSSQQGTNEAYWQNSLRQLLRNTIDLLKLAGRAVTLPDIYKAISTAPKSMEEVKDSKWQKSSDCATYLEEAYARKESFSAIERNDFEMTLDYFFNHFPTLANRTRSVVVSTFLSMADGLLRGILRDLLSGDLNVTPEDTHEGKILLIDLPVKEYAEIGQYAQVIIKYLWQQAAERRPIASDTAPIFLWADESQLFATSNDAIFQTTARSARVCTVYLTQNIPNYLMAMGGSASDRSATDALLGNFQTVIFHGNADITTNRYASDLIGQKEKTKTSTSVNDGQSLSYQDSMLDALSPASHDGRSESSGSSTNFALQIEPQVLPMEFTMLKKGGFHNDLEVEAIIFQSGRKWQHNDGSNFIKTNFKQGEL